MCAWTGLERPLDSWETCPIGSNPAVRFGTRVGTYPSAPGRISATDHQGENHRVRRRGALEGLRVQVNLQPSVRGGSGQRTGMTVRFATSGFRPGHSSRRIGHVIQVDDTCPRTIGPDLRIGWGVSFAAVRGTDQSPRRSTALRIFTDPQRVDQIFSYPESWVDRHVLSVHVSTSSSSRHPPSWTGDGIRSRVSTRRFVFPSSSSNYRWIQDQVDPSWDR